MIFLFEHFFCDYFEICKAIIPAMTLDLSFMSYDHVWIVVNTQINFEISTYTLVCSFVASLEIIIWAYNFGG